MIRLRRPLHRIFSPLDPARPLPSGLDWYVLTTEPRREYQVAHWLEAEDIPTLVPLETRWRLRDKRRGGGRPPRVRYQVPLLPRIVIAGFDGAFRFEVMDSFFITGVLGIGGIPTPMRQGEAERLQAGSERLRRFAEPRALAVGGKAVVTAPGLHQGRIVEINSLVGKMAKLKSWFESAQDVIMKQEDLEAVS